MNNIQAIKEQTAIILKEVNEQLKLFPADVLQMLYVKQLEENKQTVDFINEQTTQVFKNEKDKGRIKKMMEEARLKWTFATDKQKKALEEIQKVVQQGNERIMQLYQSF